MLLSISLDRDNEKYSITSMISVDLCFQIIYFTLIVLHDQEGQEGIY